jgi:acyl phosphate:glycerol-3-phosphate acyltransferase
MQVVLALLIGYLLGSVLPAEAFARARGVDIRQVGTGNPGATNALQQLGLVPGLITGGYDMAVGLAAMWVAWRMGLAAGWVYLSGLMAIVGHCFPVFSRFRGGQGMAATTGMLGYAIVVSVWRGWLGVPEIALLALVGGATFVLTRSASVVGVIAVPVLVAEVWLGHPEWQFGVFMTVLAVWIWIVQFALARTGGKFHIAEPVRHAWRRAR